MNSNWKTKQKSLNKGRTKSSGNIKPYREETEFKTREVIQFVTFYFSHTQKMDLEQVMPLIKMCSCVLQQSLEACLFSKDFSINGRKKISVLYRHKVVSVSLATSYAIPLFHQKAWETRRKQNPADPQALWMAALLSFQLPFPGTLISSHVHRCMCQAPDPKGGSLAARSQLRFPVPKDPPICPQGDTMRQMKCHSIFGLGNQVHSSFRKLDSLLHSKIYC